MPRSSAIVSSNGTVINDLVGADRFYIGGYTGSNSVVANIEGGYVWGGTVDRHQDLQGLDAQGNPRFGTFLGELPIAPNFDAHATSMGHIIAGNGAAPFQQGIAKDATVWSGAIAASWTGPLNYNVSGTSYLPAYLDAMRTGVNGRKADVVNSSLSIRLPSPDDNSAAYNFFSATLDALALESRFTTIVIASGNGGGSANPDVTTPADGFNSITVGAAGNQAGGFNTVPSTSSRGPSDFRVLAFDPANDVVLHGVRASVDLIAPGESMKVATYGGVSGGKLSGTNDTSKNLYLDNQAGTSLSSAVVAGGAALLTDAGRVLYGGVNKSATNAIDGRVIKAVLMNSADKIPGWNNGQSLVSGVVTTTQSLDYASGAGRMNLSRAFDQYAAPIGTHDVVGTNGGNQGVVQNVGWDYGLVTSGTPNDYFVAGAVTAGSTFTITLNWYIDRGLEVVDDGTTNANHLDGSYWYDNGFDNLDLQVWSVVGVLPNQIVAESKSLYNNVEHLSFDVPASMQYMIRVVFAGAVYNFDTVDAQNEFYGLAWSVPEPTSLGVLMLAGVALRRSRKRVA